MDLVWFILLYLWAGLTLFSYVKSDLQPEGFVEFTFCMAMVMLLWPIDILATSIMVDR